jgi:HK97 family phage major capsid protein
MAKLVELRQRKAKLIADAETLLATCDPEKGMSEEAKAKYAECQEALKNVNLHIGMADQLLEEQRSMGTAGLDLVDAARRAGALPEGEDPRRFKSLGSFLQAVASDAINHGQNRPAWLQWMTPSGANEGVPTEGGFLVQKDFSTRLLELMHQMGQVVSRVTNIGLTSNADGIKLPAVDETSRATGSRWGGVRAFWLNEADTVAATKVKFRQIELVLKKLMAISYATDEILRDSGVLEAIITRAFVEEMTFVMEDAIINGDGVGKPLGIINSSALVTVAAEGGQSAATVVTNNILKMYNRLPMGSKTKAVWLINTEIEPQLYAMVLGSGTAVVQLYRPPGTNTAAGAVSPVGTLLGLPVIPIEYASALGNVGDIMLFDLSAYITITKEGLRSDQSMHVRFLNDEMTYRWVYRLDGAPSWKSALTPYKGSATLSPFVTLAAR